MHLILTVVLGLISAGPMSNPPSPAKTVVVNEDKAIDPAMDMLGRFVGGTWRTAGEFVVEFKYEWRVPGKSIRGVGVIGKGSKQEAPSESIYGWDAEAKKVYYLDCHNHDTVYKGWVVVQDGKLLGDFSGLIGDKGDYRFENVLSDSDNTMVGTLFGKDASGKWMKLHSMTFKRIR